MPLFKFGAIPSTPHLSKEERPMTSMSQASWQPPATVIPDVEITVIGSGFSGLGMAIKLKEAGLHSFVVLEKAEQAGGTWRENTYPGCACDVPSHMYSFSYKRNPDWSRTYSTQREIFEYLNACVEKYALTSHLRFGTEVREAIYDDTNRLWTVRTADGNAFTTRLIVSAMGALHRPSFPDLPGLAQFKGTAFHSAQWNHAYDLAGKRVAVIGTGASAIQFIPEIAPKTARLVLFQRTPAWVLPRADRPIGKFERSVYRHVPGAIGLCRNVVYWRQEIRGIAFVNPKLMRFAEKIARKHLEAQVPDQRLRDKLTPRYTIGCKRILMSNNYFPALRRTNVDVVTDAIARVKEHSIVTSADDEYPVDALIYGTGFRVTDLPGPVRFVGRKGLDLHHSWRDAPEAYLGLTTAGFPNLFMLLGPNTGLGHNSVVFMAEQQISYVMKCLRIMREQNLASMEVRPEVQATYNQAVQARLLDTVWASGCKSWYQNAHGKNVALWPGFTFQYWYTTRKIRLGDYSFEQRSDVRG